ncbi:MAG: glycosyltransferase family 4 protein [Chthoniobacterales bacterium]
MRSLRVGILAPTFLPKFSGAEVFHHNLAVRLSERGHAVTVVAPKRQVHALQEQSWKLPYSLESYPENRWSWIKRHQRFAFWANRFALGSLQKKHRFDLWHAFVLYPTGVVLADWGSRSRAPCVVRAVGDDVTGLPSLGHKPHVGEAIRAKLPLVDAVVALSAEMAEDIANAGVVKGKIHIIPNAVDAERFRPNPEVRAAVRAEFGIKDGDFLFLCVARNHPQKDLATLLQAFRLLLSSGRGINARLLVVGRGVESLGADVADLAEKVHLLEIGPEPVRESVPPMPPQRLVDLYRAADCFVLSSLLEGFSSALVEAMASGLPVIATDVPGIRGVVKDGKEGVLVSPRSPRMLADAMLLVAGDPALRASLSSGARAAVARYSWSAVVGDYEKLYGDMAAARFGP